MKPEMRVQLHDVPKNWAAANFDQRLGPVFCFFSQAGALPAAKDYNFQEAFSNRRKRDRSVPGKITLLP
jgi:hypothetical protein